jgi:hypothetical protein
MLEAAETSDPMALILIIIGAVLLASFADLANDLGADSRGLSDNPRRLSYTVGLS